MNVFKTKGGVAARTLVGGFAALCFGIAVQSANAGVRDTDVKTVKVTFKDLDLSKQAGAETLYRRIKNAARFVCGPYGSLPYPAVRKTYLDCVDNAIANAVAEVNRPALAAVHREKSKRAQG